MLSGRKARLLHRAAIVYLKRRMNRKDIATQFNVKTIAVWKSTRQSRTLWDEPVRWMLDALKKNPSASTTWSTRKRNNITEKRITDGGVQTPDHPKTSLLRFESQVMSTWKSRSSTATRRRCQCGRSRVSQSNHVSGKRGKRLTLNSAIRVAGLVHMPILNPENADDVGIMKYAEFRICRAERCSFGIPSGRAVGPPIPASSITIPLPAG